jgi:hypothetical protein
MGLRVTKEEEIDGLDIHEHGANVYNCLVISKFNLFFRAKTCKYNLLQVLALCQ